MCYRPRVGLLDRLFGREPPWGRPPLPGDDRERAAEVAVFFTAHAVWCIDEGETLVPLVGFESATDLALIRLTDPSLEAGREWLREGRPDVYRAVLVHDGYHVLGESRTDALVVKAVEY